VALTIEYAPRHDGEPDPGEVVWTWVPYEDDPTQGKDRPVVIVGRFDDGTLAGVALTSQPHPELRAERIAVGTGAWDGEHRPSYAKVDRVLHVRADQVRREGAAMARDKWDAVVAAVRARGAD
jgi:hypothetical protein